MHENASSPLKKVPLLSLHPTLSVALFLAATPALHAGDFYVDAAHGSNSNSGTSWQDAWQTISHATGTAPGNTIHIAPGLYDAALGEVFPISISGGITLIGERGSAVTILDGGGAAAIFSHYASSCFQSASAHFEGLWLRNTGAAVDSTSTVSLTLRALVISGASTGVHANAVTNDPFILGSCHVSVSMERVLIVGCGTGVDAATASDFDPMAVESTVDVTVVDSEVLNTGTGLRVDAGGWATSTLTVMRTRIVENDRGIVASETCPPGWGCGFTTASVEDSLLADNDTGCQSQDADVDLIRSTIASNATCGASSTGSVDLSHCIVYGNGDDLCGSGFTAEYCDIRDGDFDGTNGNISLDPLFVDAAGGDYRLAFGSPCIESGQPAAGTGSVDLAGTVRPVDGDLDAVELPDMGAFEHAPLFLRGIPALGDTLELELWGPAGGASRILWTNAPLTTPFDTPFGQIDLDRRLAQTFAVTATAPCPPIVFQRDMPTDPSLIGTTLSFQALSTSQSGTIPVAFTNAVSFVVEP